MTMMVNLNVIVVLALMTYVLGSYYYELHPMYGKTFTDVFIGHWNWIVYVI